MNLGILHSSLFIPHFSMFLQQLVDGIVEGFCGFDDIVVFPESRVEEIIHFVVEGVAGIEGVPTRNGLHIVAMLVRHHHLAESSV